MEITERQMARLLGSSETGTQLDKPRTSIELDQVEMLMDQMQASYPSQELSPATVEMWFPLWLEMVAEFGLERFRKALVPMLGRSRFFPHPSEIREQLEAEDAAARAAREQERSRQLLAERRAEFWRWVDERLAPGGYNEGMDEQAFLDTLKTPGYIGLKARKK